MSEIDEMEKREGEVVENYDYFYTVEEFRSFVVNGLTTMAIRYREQAHEEDMKAAGNQQMKYIYESNASLMESVTEVVYKIPLSEVRTKVVEITEPEPTPPDGPYPLGVTLVHDEDELLAVLAAGGSYVKAGDFDDESTTTVVEPRVDNTVDGDSILVHGEPDNDTVGAESPARVGEKSEGETPAPSDSDKPKRGRPPKNA